MTHPTERLGLKVLAGDKEALRQLAKAEGEAMAVVVRCLIRQEAERTGLMPNEAERAKQQAQDGQGG